MADSFVNEPIPLDELPQLTDDAFVSVDPRYLRASLAGTTATALVVAIGGGLVAWRADETVVPLIVTGSILLCLVLAMVLRVVEVRRLAYQLRDHDISMRSGVVTHRVESLPFARVQHVRVHRGAIERALGLATLQVSSAGPNITIPGLSEAEASRIKLLVTQRAGMDPQDDDVVPAAPTPAPPLAAPPASQPQQPQPLQPQPLQPQPQPPHAAAPPPLHSRPAPPTAPPPMNPQAPSPPPAPPAPPAPG